MNASFFFSFLRKNLPYFFFALNSFVFLEDKHHFDVLSSLKTSNVSRKIDLFYLNNSLKPDFFLKSFNLWYPLLMSTICYQTKTPISFWYRRKLNPKSLIQSLENLSIELTGTHL